MSTVFFRVHAQVRRAQTRFSRFNRARRKALFARLLAPAPGASVIDLGGVVGNWDDFPVPLKLTVVNLPGASGRAARSPHEIEILQADACNLSQLDDGTFDIAFSNSVIEHVGAFARRAALAREIRRLGRRYWVQTPSAAFPVEAHNHMPLWWFYPEPVRNRLLRRWRRLMPARAEMIEGTTVVSRLEMRDLFPDARLITERFALLPKSYIAYRA